MQAAAADVPLPLLKGSSLGRFFTKVAVLSTVANPGKLSRFSLGPAGGQMEIEGIKPLALPEAHRLLEMKSASAQFRACLSLQDASRVKKLYGMICCYNTRVHG